MLYLGETSYYYQGVTALPDHANRQQWYYLPVYPRLAHDPETGKPAISLYKYRGGAGDGGFLSLDVDLAPGQGVLDELRRRIRAEERLPEEVQLSPLPVVDGWVRLVLLDAQTPAPGEPASNFVTRILQATKPALYGDERAMFSAQLTKEGATLVEASLHGELTVIGVGYQLDYVALRPAFQVRLSIQWDRVQRFFEQRFGVGFLVLSADIEKAISELRDARVIDLQSDLFVPEGEDADQVVSDFARAEAEVREMITDAFFTPSLEPHQETKDGWDKAVEAANSIHRSAVTGGASSYPSFSFKQVDWTRIDQKSLNIRMNQRSAVRRSIYPQGHLNGIAAEIAADPSSYIGSIDLNDRFFERRRVTAIARAGFADDQIASVHVRMRYGATPQDVVLDATTPQRSVEWLSVLDGDGAFTWPVSYDYDVTFQSVDTSQRPMQLTTEDLPTAPAGPRGRVTEDSNVEIVPREDLYSIVTVPIWAVGFPFDRWPTVMVTTSYVDHDNRLRQEGQFLVDAGWDKRSGLVWKLFVLDRTRTRFSYQLTFYGGDHRVLTMPPVETDLAQIRIADPFPQKRTVQFVPVVDWALTSTVFSDVTYTDPANHLSESSTLTFDSTHAGPQSFVVDLQDQARRQVQYQVTFINKNGSSATVPTSYTLGPRVLLRPDMRGHRVVTILPEPGDFTARQLDGIDVTLRYDDPGAQISFADTLTLASPDDRAYFEFDYVDENRQDYSYQLTYRYTSGFQRSTVPTSSRQDQLSVPLD
jgi:hypothetical protein